MNHEIWYTPTPNELQRIQKHLRKCTFTLNIFNTIYMLMFLYILVNNMMHYELFTLRNIAYTIMFICAIGYQILMNKVIRKILYRNWLTTSVVILEKTYNNYVRIEIPTHETEKYFVKIPKDIIYQLKAGDSIRIAMQNHDYEHFLFIGLA